MSRSTIRKGPSPHPDPTEPVDVVANDGTVIGTLTFVTKNGSTTSTMTYAPGQETHSPYRLRSKHRAPR